jgi:heat shock protein HslJ
MGSTAIGCDTERHEQDEWLATFLTSRPLFERDGDALTLSTDEASLNFLDSEVANPDRSLTDRTWTIDTFVRGGSASNLSLQEEPTVRFDADGTVRVFTTCNTGGGQYTASGNTLQLEAIAYTEEGCNETGSASAEQHIQEVLTEGEVQFEIDAARLTLSRGDVGLMAISE